MGLGFSLGFFLQYKKQSNLFLVLIYLFICLFVLFSNHKRKNKGYGLVTDTVVFLNNEANLTLESELS